LGVSLCADLLLIDDRKGARAARWKDLRVTGILAVLDLAAERGLIDFARAISLLEGTTFREASGLAGNPASQTSGILSRPLMPDGPSGRFGWNAGSIFRSVGDA
jgi:hypothetical protein